MARKLILCLGALALLAAPAVAGAESAIWSPPSKPAAPGAGPAVMEPAGVTWGARIWRKTGPNGGGGYFFSGFKSETDYGDPAAHTPVPPNPPPLTPDYQKIWERLRQDAFSGKNTFNVSSNCSPYGVPYSLALGAFELLVTPGKITQIWAGQGGMRTIYMDGRGLPKEVIEPQFNGYAVGRWEGKRLVVDSYGFRTDTIIEPGLPHSEEMRLHEVWTEVKPGEIHNEVTITDPKMLTKPWKATWIYTATTEEETEFDFLDFACDNNRSHIDPLTGAVVLFGPDGKPLVK